MPNTSCKGCKFLYGDGQGYSNYTWLETFVRCALDKNESLQNNHEEPYAWEEPDAWPPTKSSRCEKYSPGVYIVLDPDAEEHPRNSSSDEEQIAAILAHDGRYV